MGAQKGLYRETFRGIGDRFRKKIADRLSSSCSYFHHGCSNLPLARLALWRQCGFQALVEQAAILFSRLARASRFDGASALKKPWSGNA